MTVHLIADQKTATLTTSIIQFFTPYFNHVITFIQEDQLVLERPYWTWDQLFDVGKKRKLINNQEDHYYVFLFDGQNEHNWFASLDYSDRQVAFVQCSYWEDLDISKPKYAIAYHLITIITMMRYFKHEKSPSDIYHNRSIGCMFDFTGIKSEVIYKLKSAHTCQDCIQKIADQPFNKTETLAYLTSLKQVLEAVKDEMFRINWHQIFGDVDFKFIVTEDMNMSIQVDKKLVPVDISNGREKALFIMLLKYKNGLSYADFEKERYLKEYLGIYLRNFVSQSSMKDLYLQAKNEIERKTFRKNLHALKSKINRKLNASISNYPEIQKQLMISYSGNNNIIPLCEKKLESYHEDLIIRQQAC